MSRIQFMNRRAFLRSAAGYALALPTLPSLFYKYGVRDAISADACQPFVILISTGLVPSRGSFFPVTNHNVDNSAWLLRGMSKENAPLKIGENYMRSNATSAVSGKSIQVGTHDLTASGIGTDPSSIWSGPNISKQLSKINIIRGLSHYVDAGVLGHGNQHSWGTTHGAESATLLSSAATIDVVIEDYLKKTDPNFKAMRIDPFLGQSISYNASGQQISNYLKSPTDILNTINANSAASTPASGFDPGKSVLDSLKTELSALKSNVLSSEDKNYLDAYLQSISQVAAAQGAASGNATCATSVCAKPEATQLPSRNCGYGYDAFLPDSTCGSQTYADQARLIAASIKCNATRLVVVHLNHPNTSVYGHKESHGQIDLPTSADIARNQITLPDTTKIYKTIMDKFLSALITELGTDLDRGLIVSMSEHGYFSDGHFTCHLSVATAGGFNGQVKTGRLIDYVDYGAPYGSRIVNSFSDAGALGALNEPWILPTLPVNALWNTILQGMGVPRSHYEALASSGSLANYGNGKGYGRTATRPRTYKDASLFANHYGFVGDTLPLLKG